MTHEASCIHRLVDIPAGVFDEMRDGQGLARPSYREYLAWLASMSDGQMQSRRAEADLLFRRMGITFSVYGEAEGTERLIPSDVVPRIIDAPEWQLLSRGLTQRVTAINRFLDDVYHEQEILRAGVIPSEQVLGNAQYRPEVVGVRPAHGVYTQIAGVDIVRHSDGAYYVLEDNLRVPSGVSYMLSNRRMMMRLFPDLFRQHRVRPVDHYPSLLLRALKAASERDDPVVVLLTPGRFNSAYFEHAFLAKQMGIELVEGQDLFVDERRVFMRTTEGPRRVDVIYRRIDDLFLDPKAFKPDSMLGVPGLIDCYRAGEVAICNAVGTGVADDKSIYPYVPEMIRFYLGEEPLLNNVPTWQCREPDQLEHVLANLGDLVVKEVHGAGGYGMLVGPTSTRAEIEAFRAVLKAQPGNYIAQPTLSLSACPTFVEEGIASRHIDLRPFVLMGREVAIVPGGLTRVALRRGSLVVNSSQGGGTKDTWVIDRADSAADPAAASIAESAAAAQGD
jgi:uncharacterized circularly permuted ATP-grasp superfamily protein